MLNNLTNVLDQIIITIYIYLTYFIWLLPSTCTHFVLFVLRSLPYYVLQCMLLGSFLYALDVKCTTQAKLTESSFSPKRALEFSTISQWNSQKVPRYINTLLHIEAQMRIIYLQRNKRRISRSDNGWKSKGNNGAPNDARSSYSFIDENKSKVIIWRRYILFELRRLSGPHSCP